jgi:4-amino-4-deoxy-L-arabinose transferase-like glycosyltransferase
MRGLLQASEPSAEVTAFLTDGADAYRWVLATTGSQSAAGYQIATQQPVMSIGGFNGTDPAPTLAQFEAYVANGAVHYYLADGGGMGQAMGGSDSAAEIRSWVTANFDTVTVDGVTFYDLSATVGGSAAALD